MLAELRFSMLWVGRFSRAKSLTRLRHGCLTANWFVTGYGFDPTTGLPIAGKANIIPAADPLWSSLATAVIPNIPAPDRTVLASSEPNGFGGNSDDNNKINVRTWLFRFDHNFNDKFSINNTYYENIRPRIAHCGGPGGCTTVNNGETASAKNDTYIGQGFYQRITNHFEHLQMNWIIKPNLFNHTTLAYDRWMMLGHQLAGGVGWNQKLGLGLPNQPIFNNAGFPSSTLTGRLATRTMAHRGQVRAQISTIVTSSSTMFPGS